MNFPKLVKVLQALDKERVEKLKEYIHSPYFQVRTPVQVFFDFIITWFPDFPPKKLETKFIAQKIPSLSTYNIQSITASRLLKEINFFIALEDWQHKENDVLFHQFNAMRQLQVFPDFEQDFKKVMDKINTDPEQDVDIFYD